MAIYKNLSTRERWGDQQRPLFLFWDPLHISVTNGARKLKLGKLVGIYA